MKIDKDNMEQTVLDLYTQACEGQTVLTDAQASATAAAINVVSPSTGATTESVQASTKSKTQTQIAYLEFLIAYQKTLQS